MSLPPLWMERIDRGMFQQIKNQTQLRPTEVWDSWQEFEAIFRMQSFINGADRPSPYVLTWFEKIPIVRSFLDSARETWQKNSDWTKDHVEHATNWLKISIFEWITWSWSGRKVYMLDRQFQSLLYDTDLPKWTFRDIKVPVQSFYLILGESVAFADRVAFDTLIPKLKKEALEGMMATLHMSETECYITTRMHTVSSLESLGIEDNVFCSFSLDTPLTEIVRGSFDKVPQDRRLKIALDNMLHLVLSFILYLQSAHPELEPIPPTKRRKFSEIRSPIQRAKAEQRENEQLMKMTQLGYLYVGKQHSSSPYATDESERKLDHRVDVRGHWKQQTHGNQNKERKTIWIQPYFRGPADMAEAIRIKAQKVQSGQLKEK